MNKLLFLSLLLLGSSYLSAYGKRSHSGTTTHVSDSDSMDCEEHLQMSAANMAVLHDEESRNVPKQPLKVVAAANGAIQVHSTNRSDFAIKLCKAAAAPDEATASHLLNDIHIGFDGGTLTVSGPRWSDDHGWSGLLLVEAPAGAIVDLSARNGGISLLKFDGNATVHTTNGGISLKQTTGKVEAEATNGGISIQDCNGEIKAEVQNGGLSIRLAETWNGAGLDAHTHNGGLSIQLPRNLRSAMELRASEHAPIVCKASACEGAERTWADEGKILRVGGAMPVVRVSTVNGGVVIQDRDFD